MKDVEESDAWKALREAHKGETSQPFQIESVVLDLAVPFQVLGGRNGAGKSRVLRDIAERLGDRALLLNLHYLCEQALMILRSRDDFFEMKDEAGSIGPDQARLDDLKRVIGREYEQVDWFALEVDRIADADVAKRFLWAAEESEGDQPLVPYFEVKYRGRDYSSRDMGLGEFSIHFLFWILEQFRDRRGLTLLLDEPDAFLPPIGSSTLLRRLLVLCLERGWKLILSTHSSEIIQAALDDDAFILLQRDRAGMIEGHHCKDDPAVADDLLATPPLRYFYFVEDESAWTLAHVLIETLDRRLSRSTEIIWGKGSGYMEKLQEHFPRPPASELKYAYLFDGDKRSEVHRSPANRWPAIFLPTDGDPTICSRPVVKMSLNSLRGSTCPKANWGAFSTPSRVETSTTG